MPRFTTTRRIGLASWLAGQPCSRPRGPLHCRPTLLPGTLREDAGPGQSPRAWCSRAGQE